MKRGMQPDDFLRFRMVVDPQLSPDGAQVAFVVSTIAEEDDEAQTAVWVAPTDASAPARRFTSGPKDVAPRWSPDGRSLAFVSRRPEPGKAAKDADPQIHVASLDGGDPRRVTNARFGATQPAWSPDGARIAFVSPVGEWTPPADRTAVQKNAPRVVTSLRYRFDGIGWTDERRSHVFTVDLASGKEKQITDGDFDDGQPAWSPGGDRIAFVSDRSPTRFDRPRLSVWTAKASGGKASPVTEHGTACGAPQFSPDGRSISFIGNDAPEGDSAANIHLFVASADGTSSPRSLSAPLDRPVFGLVWPTGRTHAWSSDGKSAWFIAVDGGAHHVFRVPAKGGTPERVVKGDRQITGFDVHGNDVAFASVWPALLPEIRVADTSTGQERVVSDVNEELRKAVRLVPLRRMRTGGIESFVLRPPDVPKGEAAPTVLEIHGGPHGWHPQSVMLPLYQSLAAAGYVVVLPNPRGSHGYGEDFAYGCVGDWGGGDFDDLMNVVDSLVDRGISDPKRLYAAGYSYGGYMTGWTVGHTTRFKAACISAPVTDLAAMVGTSDIPLFVTFEMGGATPWERPDVYAKHSPITYVADVRTPVRLFHWEGDLRCPIGQAEAWFQGLKLAGQEVEMVRYPGGFHIVRAPSQMVDFVERHLDWFGTHP